MKSNTLQINRTAVFRWLMVIIGLLVTASLIGQVFKYVFNRPNVYGFVPLFNLNGEENIPAIFSGLLLLLSSILLTLIAKMEQNQNKRDTKYWFLLGMGFFAMALDEWFSYHEELAEPIRKALFPEHAGLFYFAWVIPALILVSGLAIFFKGFLSRLAKPARIQFILAAMIYLAGSIGLEMLGGWYLEIKPENDFLLPVIITLEESLELFGVVWFIRSLLEYLAMNHPRVEVNFSNPGN